MIDFNILGPVVVAGPAGPVGLSGMRRQLLAAFLCEPNRVVSVGRLAEHLWSGESTESVRSRIHLHVHRLRLALGDPDRIVRRGDGYAIVLRRGELDADRFVDLADQAHRAATRGDLWAAYDLRAEALALWRADAFADMEHSHVLRPYAARLDEMRISVQEEQISLQLVLGDHVGAAAKLRDLIGRHPWREQLVRHLMVALCRGGRQVDALEEYRAYHRRLAGELGLQPGPSLQRLQHAILTGDPTLDTPELGLAGQR